MKQFFGLLFLFFTVQTFAQSQELKLANSHYNDGEFEQALDIYEKLYKSKQTNHFLIEKIASSYNCLLKPKEALKFLSKVTKKQPKNFFGYMMEGDIKFRMGNIKEAKEAWNSSIKKLKTQSEFAEAGGFFMKGQYLEQAEKTFTLSRKSLKNKDLFTNELANIYNQLQEYEKATLEYIHLYKINPPARSGVKIRVLNMLNKDSKDAIEATLLKAIQKDSKNLGIRELLIDFYIKSEDYYEALVQARATDKIFKEQGKRLILLSGILANNNEFKLANKALDYVIKMDEKSPYYFTAVMNKAVYTEKEVLQNPPATEANLKKAVAAYDTLFSQFGRQKSFIPAMFRKAELCMFYLHDLKAANKELDEIIKQNPGVKNAAKAKLLQADIQLIQGNYNQAKFVYEEVSKLMKLAPEGTEARFKIAKLHYYKGDFELASKLLKTLKTNTSNNIANDAIHQYLMIRENLGLDTSTVALKKFADAEMLIFQKKFEPALGKLDSLRFEFPNHVLMDDILWEKAKIYREMKNFEKTIFYIDKLVEEYPKSIYADDALFAKAEIFEKDYKKPDGAIKIYLDLVKKYPASLLVVVARKQIRELRGDKLE